MKRNFSLPFDKVHDLLWGYGRLLLPIPWLKDRYGDIKWLMFAKRHKRIKKTDTFGFHNCTTTRIY